MIWNNNSANLTPKQFELEVKALLEDAGADLIAFDIKHLEKIEGVDGTYEIDITARFEALGANFLVLVECKHHLNPIKRDLVQVLHARIQSTGAQKGILFSTARFQKGATIYAKKHGIALVRVTEGKAKYETPLLDKFGNLPSVIYWHIDIDKKGKDVFFAFSRYNASIVKNLLNT